MANISSAKRFIRENKNLTFILFLALWLTINLVQSAFTGLAHDEAYYWMYSRNLAWGYFDHPPVIALLVNAGYTLFPGIFGVRFFISLMGTASIGLIYSLIDKNKRSVSLYFILCFSMVLVQSHLGGFLAIPDVPLVFFSALFLFFFKKYLVKDQFILAIALGLTGAAMLLSKYHGVLVLFFCLVANLHLLKRPGFWIIPPLIIAGILPHIFWQVSHHYPSIEYHLISRSSSFRWEHLINFLYSQLLIAGPFSVFIIYYQSAKYKVVNDFERALKFLMVGVFVFFLLSSLRGHVEAHWTAVMFVPLLILTHNATIGNDKVIRWLKILLIPTLVLVLFIRLVIVFNPFPNSAITMKELQNWDLWAKQVDSVAHGRKVVFVNSFQRASKYTFYTKGHFATSLNNIYYRKNQFDTWDFEDSIQHQPVLLMESPRPNDTLQTATGEEYHYRLIDDFVSFNNLPISVQSQTKEVSPGDTFLIDVKLKNFRRDSVHFEKGCFIVATFHNQKGFIRPQYLFNLVDSTLSPHAELQIPLRVKAPVVPGKYQYYISIKTSYLSPALNASPIKLKVAAKKGI